MIHIPDINDYPEIEDFNDKIVQCYKDCISLLCRASATIETAAETLEKNKDNSLLSNVTREVVCNHLNRFLEEHKKKTEVIL